MMNTATQEPATTPIPVQLSEPEFTACIFPHLSRPKRGPQCTLGYHRVFHLILWVLYTGMQWKCLPVPKDTNGNPAIHYTTVYKVFAIDLQKMNWKCRTGIDESMGVSLKGRRKHNAIGGYSHADQDTGQCCHGQSLAHAVATGVSAR